MSELQREDYDKIRSVEEHIILKVHILLESIGQYISQPESEPANKELWMGVIKTHLNELENIPMKGIKEFSIALERLKGMLVQESLPQEIRRPIQDTYNKLSLKAIPETELPQPYIQ